MIKVTLCLMLRDEAGFSQKQAEIQAEQMQIVKAEMESNLSTKKDIKELEERINTRIDGMGDKNTNRVWAIGFVILGPIFAMGRMGVFK